MLYFISKYDEARADKAVEIHHTDRQTGKREREREREREKAKKGEQE